MQKHLSTSYPHSFIFTLHLDSSYRQNDNAVGVRPPPFGKMTKEGLPFKKECIKCKACPQNKDAINGVSTSWTTSPNQREAVSKVKIETASFFDTIIKNGCFLLRIVLISSANA